MKQPDSKTSKAVGRGSQIEPANRFETVHLEEDLSQLAADELDVAQRQVVPTQYLPDQTRTVICENNSPDIPFRFSLNPYRGCEHGCAYCYARPGHEFLGMNAGLDFETKILVKYDAAERLRAELSRPSWQCEPIAISGVTDCYQPAERRFRITRALLEVLREARQPAGIVTKNALVTRDLDLIAPLASGRLMHVFLSITTLDPALARRLEPRTATPAARLDTIAQLSAAGVPVGVMVAPVIPGLNDQEIPNILSAARDAGATTASYILLRLPLTVEPVFRDWLSRNAALKQDRIESLIRSTREGQLSDSRFGTRMRGTGAYAQQIAQTFKVFKKKLGLDRPLPGYDTTKFQPPTPPSGQLSLF